VKDLQIDSETAMSVVHNCLVVTIQGELYDDILMRIRTDILEKIQATKVRGLILDFGTVRALDTFAFNYFSDTAKMASLLGVSTVFVGLQSGVVSALVDLEVEIADVRSALTMEDGFQQLQNISSIQDEPEDTEDEDNEKNEDDEWESDSGEE
jgi:rsbT antagonist protein RsbS